MKNIIIFFFCLSFNTVEAQLRSINIPNPSSIYNEQKMTMWCWAACNQMLLDAIGIDQTQEEQVEKLFGKIINQGAGGDFSLASQALKGSYLKRDGKKIYVYPYFSYCSRPNPNDFNVIVNHLERGIPLVMATIHHGRLCVGIDIIMSGSQRQIVNFRMLDPAIGAGSQILDMSIQEWKQQGMGFMTIDY